MSFVLDSSAALSWIFEDEATSETEALLDRASHESIRVPPIWPNEISQNLQRALRKGRVHEPELQLGIRTFALLDIQVVPPERKPNIGTLVEAMRAHQLSAYDASFLLLAQQLRLPLATLDQQLARAAAAVGIELLL